jgi:formylglycine-generating enzyme required for sulfatase activity
MPGYTDDGPFDAYLARYLGPLAPYLETYRASGRLLLLLDGLNEMPQASYAGRVGRIREVLERQPDETVLVTCRELDYVVELEGLQRVEVSALDEGRIRAFLHNYLGQVAGERLFWVMCGDEVRDLWDTWQQAGGTWAEFWMAEKMPESVFAKTTAEQDRLWGRLRRDPPALLGLARNPYLLLMTAQVYAAAGGELPANRARLFAAFVDTLLDRERKRHPEGWIDPERQKEGLAALAYAMQAERGRGTAVEREWAVARLRETVPDCDTERLLYLASSATLLDADGATIRFFHQLLQEYFAGKEMGKRVAAGEALASYWPRKRWWEPSGWEETVILMSGMEADASALLEKLAAVNPVVAARCLVEGGAQASETIRRGVAKALIARMTDKKEPPVARARAGGFLARLGDPRPGVGLRPDGLPDIAWCEVPAGPFLMGSDKGKDPQAYDDELPQHEVTLQGYRIARYPVTNAQYAAFVAAGGYQERRYWTKAGWQWKGDRSEPDSYGGVYDLPNHPAVMVAWYEAVAFCRWLTEELQKKGGLAPDEGVTLPSEAEWEKAARGTDGRVFPWGDEANPNQANYDATGIDTTSAVGCFPGGASPYGVEDLSGNVWEWCRTKWQGSYAGYRDDNDLEGGATRVLRGGAFRNPSGHVRCASRAGYAPDIGLRYRGFRVVVAPNLTSGLWSL